jgi:hypothetical protein
MMAIISEAAAFAVVLILAIGGCVLWIETRKK